VREHTMTADVKVPNS